jgi:hypothetical protein
MINDTFRPRFLGQVRLAQATMTQWEGQEAAPLDHPCSPFGTAAKPPCEDICKVSLPRPELPQGLKDLLTEYNGEIPVPKLSPLELEAYNRANEEDSRNVQAWAAEVERRTQGEIDDYRSKGWSVEPRAPRIVVGPGTKPGFSETAYWVACPPGASLPKPQPPEAGIPVSLPPGPKPDLVPVAAGAGVVAILAAIIGGAFGGK